MMRLRISVTWVSFAVLSVLFAACTAPATPAPPTQVQEANSPPTSQPTPLPPTPKPTEVINPTEIPPPTPTATKEIPTQAPEPTQAPAAEDSGLDPLVLSPDEIAQFSQDELLSAFNTTLNDIYTAEGELGTTASEIIAAGEISKFDLNVLAGNLKTLNTSIDQSRLLIDTFSENFGADDPDALERLMAVSAELETMRMDGDALTDFIDSVTISIDWSLDIDQKTFDDLQAIWDTLNQDVSSIETAFLDS